VCCFYFKKRANAKVIMPLIIKVIMMLHKLRHKVDTPEIRKFADFYLSAALLFVTPIVLQNQVLVGPLVNAILIRSGIRHSDEQLLLTSIIPSISVLASGMLLQNLTPYMMVMIPFIWLGNLSIALVSRYFFVTKMRNYFASTFFAAGVKAIILLTAAFLFLQFALVPKEFLIIFGANQLITGIFGAIIAYFIIKK
jgi:hypothetical protein